MDNEFGRVVGKVLCWLSKREMNFVAFLLFNDVTGGQKYGPLIDNHDQETCRATLSVL